LSALPTTSTNSITGTWSPAIDNTATTTYTFTPDAGQCANTATMTIAVNSGVTPTFTQVAAICSGASLSALPTTSTNSITGTWSPAIDNTATTTYTFTPDAGQCANAATMTIAVNSNTTPTFTQVAAICFGASLSALPTTSNNSVTGTWSPALNNTATTTYTFTPATGQCATTGTMTIVVNTIVTPTGLANQTFVTGQTIADIVVTGTGITWYADAALTTPLPTTTLLVDATTYYATQTSNGCTSTSLAVTVTVNLAAQSFEINSIMVYPNPVSSVLFIKHASNITFDTITLFDVSGKLILIQALNNSQIDVTNLPSGMYLLKATYGSEQFNTKFVKK
jgi:hypothetical protein